MPEERKPIDELFAAMDRMTAVSEPAEMNSEEVEREIAAMRAERRGKNDSPDATRANGFFVQ